MLNYPTLAVTLLCLSGCANTAWERTLFEGVGNSAEQCRRTARPSDAPCPTVPAYDSYAKERARVQGSAQP